MTTYPPPLCMYCQRFNDNDQERLTCQAYPKGIPDKILHSAVDHRKPYRGDDGIQFEVKKGGKLPPFVTEI